MTLRFARNLSAVAALMTLGALSPAFALEQKPYDAAAFKAAQASGKSVINDVTAPWCPTCKAQHAAIDQLAKNPKHDGVTLFKVDFDRQEAVWKAFEARSQSTLIAFAGATETGRLVGQSAVAPIEDLVQGTLKK